MTNKRHVRIFYAIIPQTDVHSVRPCLQYGNRIDAENKHQVAKQTSAEGKPHVRVCILQGYVAKLITYSKILTTWMKCSLGSHHALLQLNFHYFQILESRVTPSQPVQIITVIQIAENLIKKFHHSINRPDNTELNNRTST